MTSAAFLADRLRRAGLADVLADDTSRAAYSSDASLYRVRPLVIARPRHADEVAAALAVCREHRVPLVSRGGGTSVAGNAVGTGLVLDFSRHMTKVLSVDPDARTATVEPGTIQVALQRAAAAHGLRFGPDPSTFTRCTIGGMIGNNACGSRTLGYGRTSDNVLALDVLTGSGAALRLESGARGSRRPRCRNCRRSPAPVLAPSVPSSAPSVARYPATRSNIYCRSTRSMSPGCWWAARARWR